MIFLYIELVLVNIVAIFFAFLAGKYRRRFLEAVRAGMELQTRAFQNDEAWRQGQDDLEHSFTSEILDRDDLIAQHEQTIEASRAWGMRLLKRLTDLEAEHAMHTDHCLPVLQSMRDEAIPSDKIPPYVPGEWDWVKGLTKDG